MIARGFKPVGWVAAVGGAALGCYMLSLNVAAERAELAGLDRQIVAAKQDIRSLQTELGTRGRMSQLEQWNAEILALSSPTSGQYLENEVMLARFDRTPQTLEQRSKVQLASAEVGPRPAVPAVDFAAVGAAPPRAPAPLVRQASFTTGAAVAPVAQLALAAPAPAPKPVLAKLATPKPTVLPARKAALIDDSLAASIDAAARAEKGSGGAGGQ